MKLIRNAAFILAASVAMSSPAFAADESYTQEEIASAFDIAFGATVTSRYISRGVDYSDGPALQGYIEPSYGMFYAGAWFSTLGHDLNSDPDNVEINLYAGIRPEFGDLSLDLGYARYLFDDTGDCCGEFYAKATYAFTEQFSLGGEIYYDPDDGGSTYGVLNTEIGLPYDLTLSAAVGKVLDNGSDHVDWNIGLSYTFNDLITLDGRYHDSRDHPGRFVVSLSFDTSWSALRGR